MLRTYIDYRQGSFYCHFFNKWGLPTPEIKIASKDITALVEDLRAYKGNLTYIATYNTDCDELIETHGPNFGEVTRIGAEDDGVVIITERVYKSNGEISTNLHRMKIRRLVIEVEND